MRARFALFVALLIILSAAVLPTFAAAQSAPTSSLIVKVVAGLTIDQQAEIVARNGGTLTSSIPALRLLIVVVAPEELAATLARYHADPQVQSAELNKTRTSEAVPNDPLYVNQWALPKIGWDQIFGVITPMGSAKVALLDTGVDASHPELAGKVIPGTSILDGSNGMTDPSGHGTWLAGVIAAQTDALPVEGMAAVAYAGVQVVPVIVLNDNGEGRDSDVIAGVLWAADHGADVILMAFSAPDFSQNLQDAIDYAWSKGIVVVAAVGNNALSTPTFPAGDRGVMGVAATDQSDSLASFSNAGQAVFIAAPGVDIQTIDVNGNYIVISGTSTSAAYVAGLAAFMKAVDPTLSNGVIVGRIARNADPAGTQDQTGNGRINMPRALADTSTEFIEPAGAAPVGTGGPFVGPYLAAAAAISLSADFGQVGTIVTVTGNGFNNNATVATITFSGTAGNVATCTITNKAIDPGCSFSVPSGATVGSHTVTATSDKNDNPTAPFSVLVVTLSPPSSTYGTATSVTVNGAGFNNNRTVSITFNNGSTTCSTNNQGGTLVGCTFATLSTTPANAYTVAVAETSGGSRRNGSATFTIGQKAATWTTNPASKTYGDADPSPLTTGSGSGFAPADNVTASYSRAAGETVAGGPYHITATLSPAAVLANYTITNAGADFIINKRDASVTPNAASKTYGDADPTFTGSLSGFLAADGVTAGYTRTAGETVAGSPYTISATLSPASVLGNYNVTSNTALFTINKKTASVTPNAASKTYGDPDPALTGVLSGFIATDGVTAAYTRTAGETVAGSPYTISATLSPAAALGNYNITSNTAVFAITKKTASVTPNAASKLLGAPDPPLTGTLAGFLPADGVTAVYTRTAGETVGAYTISATLSPAGVLGNYNIAYNTATFSIFYNWSGFFQPVDNVPVVNVTKAGSAIPVKFSLHGNQGLAIFTPGYPASGTTVCGSTDPVSIVDQTVTAGSSSLTYDPTANQYVYVWKTDKGWTGCRQLIIQLNDGTVHIANFQFK